MSYDHSRQFHGRNAGSHGVPHARGHDSSKEEKQRSEMSYDHSRQFHGRNAGSHWPRQDHDSSYAGDSANTHHSHDAIDCDPHLHGDSHLYYYHAHEHERLHAQSQIELQRNLQASRQMLYDVYDYTIGMIEELEKHESHGRPIPNSGILSHVIPVSHKKPKHDVIGGIELELKVFEAQMKSHPPKVTDEARVTLVMQTIKWAASREAQDIPYGPVDHYCKNLLEILLFGANGELPSVDRAPKIKPTTEQVSEAMYQMAVQRHLADQQDLEFQRDPKKKAKLRNKRQGENLREGALRLAKEDPGIRQVLEEKGYVEDVAMDTT